MIPIKNLKCLLAQNALHLYNGQSQYIEYLKKITPDIISTPIYQLVTVNIDRGTLYHESMYLLLYEMGEPVTKIPNEPINAMIAEADVIIKQCSRPEVSHAGIVASLQHMIHYLIAGFGTCHAYAQTLEMHDAAHLFYSIVKEKKLHDKKLSGLAIEHINEKAKLSMNT